MTEDHPSNNEEHRKKWQEFLDEDDESDFELVSSIKQRLDLLDAEDEDIIIVHSKPKIDGFNHGGESLVDWKTIVIWVAILVASFSLIAFFNPKNKKEKKGGTTTSSETSNKSRTETKEFFIQEKSRTTPPSTKSPRTASPNQTNEISFSASSVISNKEHQSSSKVDDLKNPNPVSSADFPSSRKHISDIPRQKSPSPAEHKESIAPLADRQQLSLNVNESSPVLANESSSIATTTPNSSVSDSRTRRRRKVQSAATELAENILIAEDVLSSAGVTDYKSLAPKFAISLQASQHMIDSNRELESRRMFVDAHQKHLDRQLSERQHEETLQAAKYDPDWQEKLERSRDKCWNSVSRLLLESSGAYQLFKVIQPLFSLYKATGGHVATQEVMRSILSSACGCTTAEDKSFGSEISNFAPYLLHTSHLSMVLKFVGLDSWAESGLCYGYCLVFISSILFFLMMCHNCLRLLSSPAIFHHMVNVAAFVLLLLSRSSSRRPDDEIFFGIEWRFLILILVLVSLFLVTQWKFRVSQVKILGSTNHSDFQKNFNDGMGRMELLHIQVSIARYLIVALYCSSLF